MGCLGHKVQGTQASHRVTVFSTIERTGGMGLVVAPIQIGGVAHDDFVENLIGNKLSYVLE